MAAGAVWNAAGTAERAMDTTLTPPRVTQRARVVSELVSMVVATEGEGVVCVCVASWDFVSVEKVA